MGKKTVYPGRLEAVAALERAADVELHEFTGWSRSACYG